jgi:hypothetical protein
LAAKFGDANKRRFGLRDGGVGPERHKGEAEDVTDRFFDLTEAQKQQLFTFLNSL